MTDPTVIPAKPLKPDPADSPESTAQLVVALAIVAAMSVLGLGLIAAGFYAKAWVYVGPSIGMILGALATALNAPTGIGKILNASKQVPQTTELHQ
jgi:hypothetical protein